MSKPILLAYFAGWKEWEHLPLERDAKRLTHLCFAFANIVGDGQLALFKGDDGQRVDPTPHFARLHRMREINPELKLLISIGGWAADGFSDAALDAGSRERFAKAAIAFMQEYRLDGIDLDWEYPSNDMAGIKARPEDKRNFTLMLAELRQRLDALSDAEGRQGSARYLLTIAAGAGQYYLDGVEMPEVARLCDFVNLMTYDFYNGWATRAGHHTNLYNTPIDPEGDSCAKSVKLFVDNGLPRDKLVLGCAFYGRSLKGVGAAGLGAPGTPKSNGGYSYSEIAALLRAGDGRAVRHWDDDAKAPWLLVDGDQFVSYEDVQSIGLKADFVKAEGLAGAFFWEYTEDADDQLLATLWEKLG
ncbi:glycoside hydrolase family 18 protein [Chitiniphilus shinanonensis]|uniref:glycoside hydrolase family 18 protein n=1 Tax=Chitiniphilus shinanonensis TaxID=553088 RepID=UPI00302936F6